MVLVQTKVSEAVMMDAKIPDPIQLTMVRSLKDIQQRMENLSGSLDSFLRFTAVACGPVTPDECGRFAS